ncbi:MAG: pilus (MSHA type) biogenesis protein MshL [Burkholderiaceae bacterium]|nr:pilus (MSHA type) biogenesis protein MshL [Burkholderiaceae bacterium]
MKHDDIHPPLYGRLVHTPSRDPHKPDSSRWPWLMPWVLAAAAVALTLLLSSCATPRAGAGGASADTSVLPEIRQGLSEPSRQPPEAIPPEVARELLPQADLSLSKLAGKPPEPRFDLNVVALPVAEVFGALARDTRYSIVLDPALKASVTVSLKDVTLIEALESLRDMYGFEYRVQGNRIFVEQPTLQTRVFQVNYPVGSRTGRSDVRVTSGSITVANTGQTGTGQTAQPQPQPGSSGTTNTSQESSRITTDVRNDLWPEIAATLKLLVTVDPAHPDGRQLIVSPQSGVIVVRAMPAELRSVENYLRAMQVNVEREVMLESKIIEVTLTDSTQTGVNWSAFHAKGARSNLGMLTPGASLGTSGAISDQLLSGTPGSAIAQAQSSASPLFGLAFQTGSFAALMEFLQTQGNVQVLSSPRIAAVNNQQAVLKVGTDDFFITGITTNITAASTVGATATTTQSISLQPFFSGVALDVTPQIDDEGNIILHVHPSVSSVTEKNKSLNLGTLGTYTLPLASSTVSETDTVVRVRDGNIVAIGGLMNTNRSDSRSGLPGNSSVPILGALFRSSTYSQMKQELVILIKPTVVQSQGQLDALRGDALQRLEAAAKTSPL